MSRSPDDPRMAKALVRYQVISPYLAADPPRGRRTAMLSQLAAKVWTGPDGEPLAVAAETIRGWVRRYRRDGLDGLMDKLRPRRGVQVLTDEERALVVRLKTEVPERSLDRIIAIAERMGLAEPGRLRRSTVHRVLQAAGVSARAGRVPDAADLDRFEADRPGDLWHSDLLVGPWLPDPDRPGKVRRAKLYAFLDDHSRLLLAGRFHFSERLPHLELVFRQALRRWGVPTRTYYDNGAVYRSAHMRQVVAELGIHRIVFTQPYRPMGHGKIEAANRLIRASFLAELKASAITTLDQLNEAFSAWADEYNRAEHGETGKAPVDAYRSVLDRVSFVDEERLRQAFLFKEARTADKTGVLSLLGTRYQVSARLAGRKVEVRYDPEELGEIEVWTDGSFVERARPLQIRAHRRPKAPAAVPAATEGGDGEPVADWLGHLVAERRERLGDDGEPSPRQFAERARAERAQADDAVLAVLRARLDPEVVDEDAVRDWLGRFGPIDAARLDADLQARLGLGQPADLHVTDHLDTYRDGGGR